MIALDTFLFFLGASLILLIAPGPAILYVVTESVAKGPRSGVIASAGLTVGNLVHVVAATVGLSALLASSAFAFGVVRYGGAAYLVFLGVRQIVDRCRSRSAPRSEATLAESVASRGAFESSDPWRSFQQGLVVNTLNPKIGLFFLAFFPQFVDPSLGSTTMQILLLGIVFAFLTLVVDIAYALAAGTAAGMARRRWSGTRGPLATAGGFIPGLVYIGLGLAAAFVPTRR